MLSEQWGIKKGLSSKIVFQRAPQEDWKTYLPESETFIYTNFYLRRTLSEILQPGKEYLIFLAAEIQFHKITDVTDTMTIFSSYRNQRWLTIEYNSLQEINRYADEMLANFNIQILEDIDALHNKKESGWVFDRIIKMTLVKIERNILHGPSFGHRGHPSRAPSSCAIHPQFKTVLNPFVVALPDHYIPSSYCSAYPNICVPLAIILKLEQLKAGSLVRNRNVTSLMKNVTSALRSLRFSELQTPENDFKIYKKDFPKLEDINEGFSDALKQQYSFLHIYRGFSINMFKLLGQQELHKGNTARLTTSHLSRHWNCSDFLQIDLLDSSNVLDPPIPNHVLIILNYFALINHRKDHRYNFACRSCQRIFTHSRNYRRHITQTCSPSPTAPRRAKNFILHKTFIKDRYTGKKKRHTVSFTAQQYHKTFQNLIYGTMDMESTNKPMQPGLFSKKTPNSSIFYQKPFAFSLCFTTPYNLPLPDNLKNITVTFFDERLNTLDDFYLRMLTTLRQAVADTNKFIFDIMTLDNGPPNLNFISEKDRNAYINATHCSFCGKKFNTKIVSRKNRNKVFTVKKNRHHNHFIPIPNLAKIGGSDDREDRKHEVIVPCSACNVSTYQAGFLSRNDLRIGLHNGAKYDFCFLADAITRVGHTRFNQITEDGRVVNLPLIKGDPNVLCKDKNTILQLVIRFNCFKMKSCPFHSPKNQSRRWASCPYEKKLCLFDSALMITASLDNMLQDVRSIHQNKNLQLVFPRTHHFVTSQMGYQEEVFLSVLNKKIPQPFEMIDSLKYALDMKNPPPIAHFFSRLSGDELNGKPSISQQSYNDFVDIWKQIDAKNYFDILALYSGCDSTILCDVLSFYYGQIFRVSGLSAIEFVTCASLSWQAALLNSKSPYNQNKPLKIRVPSRKIFSIYKGALRGGYAFVNANYCEFRDLEVGQTNSSVPENMLKQASFEDVNGLYMSLLKQRISIGNYVFYSRLHNKKEFETIAQHLCSMNIDFFSKELHEKNHMFFFVVIMSYDDDALFAPQNIDLSFFPFYDRISLDMLSSHQRTRAQRLKRDPGKENFQLVSYLKKDLKTSDFASNLLYMQAFHNATIKRVVKIVRSTAFPVFNRWLSRLEEEKRRNVSSILKKTYKQFGNNIAGETFLIRSEIFNFLDNEYPIFDNRKSNIRYSKIEYRIFDIR